MSLFTYVIDAVCFSWQLTCCCFAYIEDPVVNFMSDCRLSSCCLQDSHWKQIFHGIGREYDAAKQYKVEELISLHLVVYSQLIDSVLSSAIDAYGVEHRFERIRLFWMERKFSLAKHLQNSSNKCGDKMLSILFLSLLMHWNHAFISWYHLCCFFGFGAWFYIWSSVSVDVLTLPAVMLRLGRISPPCLIRGDGIKVGLLYFFCI